MEYLTLWTITLLLTIGGVHSQVIPSCKYTVDAITSKGRLQYCYLFETASTFSSAKDRCRLLHSTGTLAIDRFQTRHTVLQNAMSAEKVTEAWIGAEETVGSWTFVNGDPLGTFNNWDTGEPSSVGNCASMVPQNWLWRAQQCVFTLNYICERVTALCQTSDSVKREFQYNGKCYSIHFNQLNWLQAEASCKSEAGTLVGLVSITDTNLQAEISRQLASVDLVANRINGFWIGLTKTSWQWVDNTKVTNSFWEGSNPVSGSGQCMALKQFIPNSTPEWLWVNAECSTTKTAICQIENLVYPATTGPPRFTTPGVADFRTTPAATIFTTPRVLTTPTARFITPPPTTPTTTTIAPTTAELTTEAPTTVAPTTAAPTPEAPTTAAPAAPTTAAAEAPTTAAPAAEAPTTAAPATVAPTTGADMTTEAANNETTANITTVSTSTPAFTTPTAATTPTTTLNFTTPTTTVATTPTAPTTPSTTLPATTAASQTTAGETPASPTTASDITVAPTTAGLTTAVDTTVGLTTAAGTTVSPTTDAPTTDSASTAEVTTAPTVFTTPASTTRFTTPSTTRFTTPTAAPKTCSCQRIQVSGPEKPHAASLGFYTLQTCDYSGRNVYKHDQRDLYLYYSNSSWAIGLQLDQGAQYIRVNDSAMVPTDVNTTWSALTELTGSTYQEDPSINVSCACSAIQCQSVEMQSAQASTMIPGEFVRRGESNGRPYYENTQQGLFLYLQQTSTCTYWAVGPTKDSSTPIMVANDIALTPEEITATWNVHFKTPTRDEWSRDTNIKLVCRSRST